MNKDPRLDNEALEAFLDRGLRIAEQEGEEALAGYLETLPAPVRQEVEPLLRLALTLQQAPEVKPRPAFRQQARKRLMRRIRPPWFVTFWRQLRLYGRSSQTFAQRRLAMTWIVALVAALTALLGGGGAVYASESALPGDTLYPVKTLVEDVQLALSGPEQDAQLLAQFAQRRMEEVQTLAAEGRFEDIPLAMARYQEEVQAMVQVMAQIGQPDPEQIGQGEALLAHHVQVLQVLAQQVPPQAKPALEHALQVSQQGLAAMQQHRSNGPQGTPGGHGNGAPMGTPGPGGPGMPGGPGGNGQGKQTPTWGTPMPGGQMGPGNGGGEMWTPMPGEGNMGPGSGGMNTAVPGGQEMTPTTPMWGTPWWWATATPNGDGHGNGGMGGGGGNGGQRGGGH